MTVSQPPVEGMDIEAAIRTNYATQCVAMVASDAEQLDSLLADGFTLTHMTGFVQARDEWIADVRSGEMRYHAMQDVSVTVDLDGDRPSLTAKTRTEATIWGGHGTWPLLLVIEFVLHDGRWLAARTVASTWR